MQLLFDPSPYHPLAHSSGAPSCSPPPAAGLFLFAEHGCLLSEQIHLYRSKVRACQKGSPLHIHFFFPSERDFLIRKVDSNSGRRFELKEKFKDGTPALLDEEGRPQEVKGYLEEMKRCLAEIELESFDYVQELAVKRFCTEYFEADRELFFFVFSDRK